METPAQTAIVCPECKSEKFFRDGKRKLSNGETAQRYVCRICGYRYTSPTSLNAVHANLGSSQICAEMVKNLEPTQKNKFCAEDVKLSADVQGLLAQFYGYLEKTLTARQLNILRKSSDLQS